MKPLWPDSGGIPPQHRQLPDTYAETLVSEALGASLPNAWGVSDLEVDFDAGAVHVTRLAARFPSGTCVYLRPGMILSRAVPRFGDGALSLDIGLAKPAAGVPCVADSDLGGGATPYVRADEHLQPNLRLLVGPEEGPAYERIPLARAVRGKLDASFSPPLLRILPGSRIASNVQAVVVALQQRQAGLLATRAARPLDLRALRSAGAPQLLALSTIHQALLALRMDLPPHVLHRVLADALAGLESLLEGDLRPRPGYAHPSPGPGFAELTTRLLEVIPNVAREPYRAFPFERRDRWTYELTLDEPEAFQRRVYLGASGVDERSISALLLAHAKIASAAWLPNVVQQAIRGVPIATDFDAPAALPSSATHACFKIDTRSDMWRDALERRSLAVHVPEAPQELTLTLYALN